MHSANEREHLLLPEIERQQQLGKEVVFLADAAFAKSEIYDALKERGAKYAIRIPANESLPRDIPDSLTQPLGRPSHKQVVYDGKQPIYNTRFLAFATHYGFRPWACRPRRPQTKGKIERPFWYIEKNLLNGRTLSSHAHLNEVTAHWLAKTADVSIHQETKRRPIDLYQEEKPHLLPLPAHPYDTALVLYRTVNPEGCVPYLQNFHSVPWQRIGELLPLRITEQELIVYGPDLAEIARHELYPSGITGEKHTLPEHSPGRDLYHKLELLKERFTELGVQAVRFLDGIVQSRWRGQDEAFRVLALLSTYRRVDLVKAFGRACRYRAFFFSAVERILAAQARPRSDWEALQDEAREHLDDILRKLSLSPRPTAEYQQLLEGIENPTAESETDDNDEFASPLLEPLSVTGHPPGGPTPWMGRS